MEQKLSTAQSRESKQDVLKLLLFKCANRVCELEFLIFEERVDSIAYCPKCKGMIVKNLGALRVGIVE